MSTLKLRKIFAAFTLTTLVASLFVVAPATQAAPPSWWTIGTELLDQVDPVYGDVNDRTVDKCRVSAVLTAALGLEENPAAAASFTDVPEECKGVAGAMIASGIIKGEGNDGVTFGAEKTFNRAVFAVMLSRAFNLDQEYPNATLSAEAQADLDAAGLGNAEWATEAFAQVLTSGIYTQLRSDDEITIYAVTTAIGRALDPSLIEQPTEPVGDGGDLTVSLSSSQPNGGNVPGGVSNAWIASYTLSAGEDDVEVSAINLVRGGINQDGIIDGIAFFDQYGQRISNAKNFNSDDTARISLLNGGYTIEAGDSVDFNLFAKVGDAATYSSQTFFVEVDGADGIVSNASSVTLNKTESPTFEVKGANAATLKLEQGSPASDVSIGEQGVTVFEFELEGDNDSDIEFKGITLKEEGTFQADSDLMNYELYLDGELVAETEMATDKYVSFLLSEDFMIEEDRNYIAEVRADVISGASETVYFSIDSEIDVFAVDQSFGVGADIDTSDFPGGPDSGAPALDTNDFMTIEAGDITLVAIDAPMDEFAEDTDDVVLGTLRVNTNGADNLNLERFALEITNVGSGTLDVSDMIEELRITGEVSEDLVSSTPGDTENWVANNISQTLPSETFDIVIVADFADTIADIEDQSLQIRMTGIGSATQSSSSFYVEEGQDDEPVTDITPGSLTFEDIDGAGSSLELTRVTQAALPVVIGSQDVNVMEFELEAGPAQDVEVSRVSLYAHDNSVLVNPYGATLANGIVSDVSLYVDSVDPANLLDSESSATGGVYTLDFNSRKVLIDADSDRRFFVVASFDNDEDNDGEVVRFSVQDVNARDENKNIEAEDASGTEVSSTNRVNSARVVTLTENGTLAVDVDATDPLVNTIYNVTLGSKSPFIASYEFTATEENFDIEDFTIQFDSGLSASEMLDIISGVEIYAEDGVTLLASKVVSADDDAVSAELEVEFDNISTITINEGPSQNLYVKVMTHPYGKSRTGLETAFDEPITAALQVTKASGENVLTESDIEHDGATDQFTDPSLGFNTRSVTVSGLSFVESANGVQVDKTIKPSAENVLAILKVDGASHSNTQADGGKLELQLDKIALDVNLTTVTAISGASIERLGGSGETVDLTVADATNTDTSGSLSSADLFTDYDNAGVSTDDLLIQSGEVAYFAIRGTIVTDAGDDNESVSVSLNGLKGDSLGNTTFTYLSNDAGAELTEFLNLSGVSNKLNAPYVTKE